MVKETELLELMSPWKKLWLKIFGEVNTGFTISKPGWPSPQPLYAFKCKKHGIVQDYRHGYNEHLRCPKCLEEKWKYV